MNFEQIKQLYSEIDSCSDAESAFIECCENNKLNLAQELHKNCTINFNLVYLNCLFVAICQKRYLDVAMWLKSAYPQIDHTFENFAIQHAVSELRLYNESLNKIITTDLMTAYIKPDKTSYNDTNRIIKWLISIWPLDKMQFVIYFCYSANLEKIIKYIICYHDCSSIQFIDNLTAKYQNQFYEDVERYSNNVKSARKN